MMMRGSNQYDSDDITSGTATEFLFNRILQSSIIDDDGKSGDETTVQAKQIDTDNTTNQILIKVCPYLFKSSSPSSLSKTTTRVDNDNNIHPKFNKLHQKLTKYIKRKLEKQLQVGEIENHVNKLMDNLMWNHGEVIDFFNEQEEWLQSNTQYSKSFHSSGTSSHAFKIPSTTPSSSSFNFNTDRTELQNTDLIWEQLKTEIFEILLNVMGETSITLYEFKHALRTALYQLQLKEREYRRIPKELLEIAIDKFLPNAQNGRSLVQFIVSELKRLKSETDTISTELKDDKLTDSHQSGQVTSESTTKRAFKIISMTIMQLLQRRLIPIPGIQMLDDEKNTTAPLSLSTDKESSEPTTIDRRKTSFTGVRYKGILDFSKKVYSEYLNNNKNVRLQRRKDFFISMDDNSNLRTATTGTNNNNLSYWNSNTFSSYGTSSSWNTGGSGSSRFNNIGGSSTMSREIDNWMNQYRDIVGPINIQVPLYRNPKKQIEEKEEQIKKKKKELQHRLQFIENLESVWELSEHKLVLSEMIGKTLQKKFDHHKHLKHQALIEREILKPYIDTDDTYILPDNLSTEFKNILVDRMKIKLSNMELESFLERKDEISKMLGENLKDISYPSFLNDIKKITRKAIENFRELNSVEHYHREQIQVRSFQFLKAMREEIGQVPFSKFQHLISSEGPLHNLPIVQSLMKKSIQYIETNIRYRDILPYLSKSDIELECSTLLFEWIFNGNDDEEKLKDLLLINCREKNENMNTMTIQHVIENISNYVLNSKLPPAADDEDTPTKLLHYIPYKWEERIEVVRDYCITNLIKHKHLENEGEHFVLNYVNSLQETLEYESFYTDTSDTGLSSTTNTTTTNSIDSQFEKERQQVIRKTALKHIETVICKTDEERQWFQSKLETYNQKKAKEEQDRRKFQTKNYLRRAGVIEDETSFKSKVKSQLDKYERYQYRLTQDEEQKLLNNQLELETRGRSISTQNYDRQVTEQRRKILFE